MDNSKLISMLNAWAKDMCVDNYRMIKKELMEGNSFLMLPSGKSGWLSKEGLTYPKPPTIQLATVYNLKGIQVLGAFTDDEAVLKWSEGRATPYNSMRAKAVFDICEKHGIRRVVINSGSDNMFWLTYSEDISEEWGATKR